MSALLDSSLFLARSIGPVLPLRTRGKEPLGELAPHGKDDATADEATITRWWSMEPTANIGVRTGGDFFVLDVDPRNGGNETMEQLVPEHGGLPPTVTVLTGGGGAHYYFMHPGGKLKTTAGTGIDVKREGGYVVAPPSVHPNGTIYNWAPGCAPTEIAISAAPEWLIELIRELPAPSPQSRPAANADRPDAYERARRYLAAMPPAISGSRGHDALFMAAQALVRGFQLSSEDALNLLLSEYNPRCQPAWTEKELAHKVDGASNQSSLPWGYLLNEEKARTRNRQAEPACDPPEPGEAEVEEPPPISDADAPAGAGDEIVGRYIYVREQDAYFAPTTGAVLTRAAINSTHAADRARGCFRNLEQRSNPKPSTYIDERARQTDNLSWWPGKPVIYRHDAKELANTFRPPPVPPVDRPDPAPWLEHLKWLIPVEAEREHLLDVLAYNVQHLEGKVNHAIVLGGAIRTGKDMLLQPLFKWLRSSYVNVKHEELDGAFQHYLKNAKFLAVQEARDLSFEQGFTRYNAFKTIIAAPPEELSINEKFLRPYNIPNLVQVIFLTNYPNGVYFEDKGDGRYFVIWSPVERRESAYYMQLGAFIEQQFMDVIGFLARRDVRQFNPKALPPSTAAREEMHAATRSGAELALVEAADTLANELAGVFTKADLTAAAQRMNHRGLVALLEGAPARLGKILKDAGLDTTKVKAGGGKVSIYWRHGTIDASTAEEVYRRRVRVVPGASADD